MTNLSDTQCILLSNASLRDDGSIYPLSSTLKHGGGTTKAVDVLLRRGFAEEREATNPDAVRRTEGDVRYGVFITSVGATVIGAEDWSGAVAAEPAIDAPVKATKVPLKATMVLGLLGRDGGATLAELIEATGWLPHTTRAALTGIRKKGHVVERTKRDGATCYCIVGAA